MGINEVKAAKPAPVLNSKSAGGASPGRPDVAKENFLLKAEIEQLRQRHRKQETTEEELRALRAERDAIRIENEKLRADVSRLERDSQAWRRSAEERDVLRAEVAEERDALRAEVSKFCAQDQRS